MPRGKKSCPKCSALVGPRLKVCACGHEFTFTTKPEPPRQSPPKIPPRTPLKPDEHGKLLVVANDEEELRKFIGALKDAANKSRHSGGGHAAFFHAKDGTVVQFDVQFPYKLP